MSIVNNRKSIKLRLTTSIYISYLTIRDKNYRFIPFTENELSILENYRDYSLDEFLPNFSNFYYEFKFVFNENQYETIKLLIDEMKNLLKSPTNEEVNSFENWKSKRNNMA